MDVFTLGINNLIQESSVTTTSQQTSNPVTNIQDASLSTYRATAGATIVTIDIGATQSVDFISLHNVNFTSLIVVGKLDATTVFSSQIYGVAQVSGFEYKNLVVDIGDGGDINTIDLIFSGGQAPQIGYVFAGEKVGFDITAMQPFDISTDAPSATNGNTIAINDGYSYRRYTMSLAHESIDTLRAKIRSIIDDGYATPRGMSIAGCFLDTDYLLGVFDSGQFGYSINTNKDETTGLYKATLTIGIRETIGENI